MRTPEGEIEVVTHDAPTWAERWAKVPLMRGIMGLGESMALGLQGAVVVGRAPDPRGGAHLVEGHGLHDGRSRCLLFTAIFILIPAFVNKGIADYFGVEGFAFHLLEGGIRLAIFLGYLLLIALIKDIKRVFQYHGAEHKAIAAYENDVEVTAEVGAAVLDRARALRHQLPAHGDAVTIFVYSFVGRPSLPWLIAQPDHPDPADRRASPTR